MIFYHFPPPVNPPEKGEGFQAISDDFQELIMPGRNQCLHSNAFGNFTMSERFDTLATSVFLWILPGCMYFRRHSWRPLLFECHQPWIQCTIYPIHDYHFTEHLSQWLASPACTELETTVMDWAANLLGLDRIFTNASGIGGGVIQVHPMPQ